MAHILLGVTGSIAAFKACHLASDWSKQGHEVRVVMTAAAQEFVTPLTFSSLTHTQTRTSMFAAQRNDCDVAHTPSDPLHINHVDDAKSADMLVIAPRKRGYHRKNRMRYRRRPTDKHRACL